MKIQATKEGPYINLSEEDSLIEIIGQSYSEDVSSKYAVVCEWIEKEMPKLDKPIKVVIKLLVFNSVTHKELIKLFSLLRNQFDAGKKISVEWYVDNEDEDSIELIEELTMLYNLPVEVFE